MLPGLFPIFLTSVTEKRIVLTNGMSESSGFVGHTSCTKKIDELEKRTTPPITQSTKTKYGIAHASRHGTWKCFELSGPSLYCWYNSLHWPVSLFWSFLIILFRACFASRAPSTKPTALHTHVRARTHVTKCSSQNIISSGDFSTPYSLMCDNSEFYYFQRLSFRTASETRNKWEQTI